MTNITQSLKVILLAVILSFGISYAFAWVSPTVAPTGGNDSMAPLNTSNKNQEKIGGLTLDSLALFNTASTSLQVNGGAVFGGGIVVGDTTEAVAGSIRFDGTDFLGYTGTEWKSLSAVGGGGGYAPGSKTYTASGVFTFSVPNDVYSISAEVWGGGGGGGFGPFSMNYKGQHFSAAGGGGGGGGYSRVNSYSVTPGEKITVVVGHGGLAGRQTGLNFGRKDVTIGGSGFPSRLLDGASRIILQANGGEGGVSHDYNCNGGSCNGMMMCERSVKAIAGDGSKGTVKLPGENGSGCSDDSQFGSAYKTISQGGKSGKVTNYLGNPVPTAGLGGIGTHNRYTPNKDGNPGQVILWW